MSVDVTAGRPVCAARVCAAPCVQAQDMDFAVTFGGDGSVLHCSRLFPRAAPPLLAFGLGTLSFLPPIPLATMATVLTQVTCVPGVCARACLCLCVVF